MSTSTTPGQGSEEPRDTRATTEDPAALNNPTADRPQDSQGVARPIEERPPPSETPPKERDEEDAEDEDDEDDEDEEAPADPVVQAMVGRILNAPLYALAMVRLYILGTMYKHLDQSNKLRMTRLIVNAHAFAMRLHGYDPQTVEELLNKALAEALASTEIILDGDPTPIGFLRRDFEKTTPKVEDDPPTAMAKRILAANRPGLVKLFVVSQLAEGIRRRDEVDVAEILVDAHGLATDIGIDPSAVEGLVHGALDHTLGHTGLLLKIDKNAALIINGSFTPGGVSVFSNEDEKEVAIKKPQRRRRDPDDD
jgi:hypothetical protein